MRAGERIDGHGEPLDSIRRGHGDETGFVDRQKIEAGRYICRRGRHWSSSFAYPRFASLFRAVFADQRRGDRSATPDLAAIKAAMAAAHPDSGTPAAFIEARQRYVAARRVLRVMRASEAAP